MGLGRLGGAGERYMTEGRVYGVEYFDGMQRMPHWVVARAPCRISRLAYKQTVECVTKEARQTQKGRCVSFVFQEAGDAERSRYIARRHN